LIPYGNFSIHKRGTIFWKTKYSVKKESRDFFENKKINLSGIEVDHEGKSAAEHQPRKSGSLLQKDTAQATFSENAGERNNANGMLMTLIATEMFYKINPITPLLVHITLHYLESATKKLNKKIKSVIKEEIIVF
jgi:hypothetical protein